MHRFQFTRRLLEILHDARLSVRALIARPLFILTTVMTFALGIGATAVVFSPALFDVLGIPPMLGRSFTRDEDAPGRNAVVIITHGFWQRRLAGDPAVIGRVLTLDSVPAEIVGVLPATFRLPQLPQLSVPNRVDNPFELFRPLAGRTTCAAPGVSLTTQSSFDGRRESPPMRPRPSSPQSPGPITRGRRFTLTPSQGR